MILNKNKTLDAHLCFHFNMKPLVSNTITTYKIYMYIEISRMVLLSIKKISLIFYLNYLYCFRSKKNKNKYSHTCSIKINSVSNKCTLLFLKNEFNYLCSLFINDYVMKNHSLTLCFIFLSFLIRLL